MDIHHLSKPKFINCIPPEGGQMNHHGIQKSRLQSFRFRKGARTLVRQKKPLGILFKRDLCFVGREKVYLC